MSFLQCCFCLLVRLSLFCAYGCCGFCVFVLTGLFVYLFACLFVCLCARLFLSPVARWLSGPDGTACCLCPCCCGTSAAISAAALFCCCSPSCPNLVFCVTPRTFARTFVFALVSRVYFRVCLAFLRTAQSLCFVCSTMLCVALRLLLLLFL